MRWPDIYKCSIDTLLSFRRGSCVTSSGRKSDWIYFIKSVSITTTF